MDEGEERGGAVGVWRGAGRLGRRPGPPGVGAEEGGETGGPEGGGETIGGGSDHGGGGPRPVTGAVLGRAGRWVGSSAPAATANAR